MSNVTIQNEVKDINDFRFSTGETITLLKDQARDVSEKQALEIIKEFPFVKVISFNGEEANQEIQPQVSESGFKKTDSFVDELTKGQEFPCTICDRKFNTHQGMRRHIASCKAQGDNA